MELSGFIALFAAIILSRIINERGYRTLDDGEKVRLMDGFSRTRAYALIPVLVLIGGYYLLVKNTDLDKGVLTIGYFGLLVAFVIIRTVVNQRKLVALDLPADYRRYFLVSQMVSLVGVAWFLYTVVAKKLGA